MEATMTMMKWKCLAALGLVFGMSGVTWGLAQRGENNRFFELRVYTASPDRLDKLVARFRNHTTRLFEKHGMTNMGYWTAVSGDNAERTLVYILAYPSREAREASWKAFQADPEWQQVAKESQADGIRLAERVDSRYMVPTDFSPLK
jgi:hypothetical protein